MEDVLAPENKARPGVLGHRRRSALTSQVPFTPINRDRRGTIDAEHQLVPSDQIDRWFVCLLQDNIFVAIERCLDNGTGECFVLGDNRAYLGRISLDSIATKIASGDYIAEGDLSLFFCATGNYGLRDDQSPDQPQVVTPLLDDNCRLNGVRIARANAFVPVARPDLSHREFRALMSSFLSTWISSRGPSLAIFEDSFARYIGVDHGVAVASGTAALHLALLAIGVGPGDEVIVPDLTFAATINAVIHCGATPVIVDIDPHHWTISAECIAAVLTSRTKAVIPVHLYGRPADMAPIMDLARTHGFFVIEDCAEAHGARYRGKPVGQFGDIACFSFYGNKIMTTGEGGMCLTRFAQYAERIKLLRDHGTKQCSNYWHDQVGFNYRMTNLQASLGVAQLGRLDVIADRNRRLDALYRQTLSYIPGVTFPPEQGADFDPAIWLVSIQVPAASRTHIIRQAAAANIELRPFFNPLSRMPPYAAYGQTFPNSTFLAATGVNLPTSHAVDLSVVEKIADVLSVCLT